MTEEIKNKAFDYFERHGPVTLDYVKNQLREFKIEYLSLYSTFEQRKRALEKMQIFTVLKRFLMEVEKRKSGIS